MKSITRAGVVLGLGLGGFLDGIVLHQILGWHHLICVTESCAAETVAGLKQQVRQDGFFHLATWLLTVVGIGLLFSAARKSPGATWREVGGAMLGGWGAFNLIEGLVDHQLLGIHHVRPGHPHEFLFDMLFLVSGVLLILAGAGWARAGATDSAPRRNDPTAR
ncbi:MAG TPA: DUF2243 domain-containing protein [Lacunisphaera sp.]|nr:DUF2243 domain-containing protein [Lacunisphaera sp.]